MMEAKNFETGEGRVSIVERVPGRYYVSYGVVERLSRNDIVKTTSKRKAMNVYNQIKKISQ